MRSFDMDRRYRLITAPFRPLQHLYTVDDQISCFETLTRHLRTDGELLFDLFQPRYDLLMSKLGEEVPDLEWPDPNDEARLMRRSFKRTHLDLRRQVFEGEFIFRCFAGDEQLEEVRTPLKMSWYTLPQLQLLFKGAGLVVVHAWGGFDRCSIDEGGNFVFLLRRA